MQLIDLLTSPWAIVPEKLLEIQEIYSTHLRGEKIDLSAVEARLGRPLANDQQEYRVEAGGVAVLPIQGVIAAKANLFTRISGGASAQMLEQQVQSMRADPRIRAAVLDIDSPGGSVLGTPALAAAVRALAAEKPTVAVSTGQMASAAYWVGSAANAIYISGETDIVGSIGVVATHSYRPQAAGMQTTEVTAGRYKRVVSDSKPLDKEGRAYLQAQVDEIYRVFVDAVAVHRKVSADQVLEQMADGRIWIGQQAIDRGLADGVATVDQMVERLIENPDAFAARRKAKFVSLGGLAASDFTVHEQAGAPGAADPQDEPVPPVATATTSEVPMTPQELAAKFAAENPDAAKVLRAEGGAAERQRIADVREQLIPGHEALVDQLAADGQTTGAQAAVKILAAEKARIAAVGEQRRSDAPKPVAQAAAESDPSAPPAKLGRDGKIDMNVDAAALDAAARQYMAQHPGTNYVAAVKAVQAL